MNLLNSFSNFVRNFSISSAASIASLFKIIQLGSDIDGEAAGDQSGGSVSMNAAGDRVAIGARANDGNGVDSGHVRVYAWNGTAWNQLGANINGEVAGDQSGTSVSMNAAGDRVAIGSTGNTSNRGCVRVYSWNGSSWVKLGANINGERSEDQFGTSISMNAVGDRVAISAPYNDDGMAGSFSRGNVQIFSWNGTAWSLLGAEIIGESSMDASGTSISMNDVGDRVAIGTINNGNGHVRIYSWNGTSWNKLGVNIVGESYLDRFGCSISMNAVGDRVAIGARANDGNGVDSGHARVYAWNGTAWNQLGSDIDGEAAGDLNGFSVSINAAGDRVMIGARANDGNGVDSGHVRIYSWDGSAWIKLAQDIDGEAIYDTSGYSVSMNAAGDRVVIGAIYNDGTVPNSNVGHVRVYSLQ
jgi:hypothetical protein